MMNKLSPVKRSQFINCLISNYKPHVADMVIFCYENQFDDTLSNDILKEYATRRDFKVKKHDSVFRKQAEKSRTGYSRRRWTMDEMNSHWKELCSICLVTGIPDATLDLNWNR